jgi:molybdate transport system permease protein
MMEWVPILLSFKLAIVSTLVLLVVCFPLACLFVFTPFRGKALVEAFTTLPIIIPPSVLGFYLLMILSPTSAIGAFFLDVFQVRLAFTFSGLVIAACIFSLPFMFQPLATGLESMDKCLIEASYVCGKSRLQTFFGIILPNIKGNVLMAMVMTFAHTMGGFGVFLMVGGSIPGETNIVSIAIYEKVMELDFVSANTYSFFLLAVSFVVLGIVFKLKRRKIYGVET